MDKNTGFKIILVLILIIGFILIKIITTDQTYANYKPLINNDSSCINCHSSMSGFASSHSPDKITCISCHLGDNHSLNKIEAHKNMVSVPGNLSNASQTCAKCHVGIDLRVTNSLMNTMSGIISVDKYVFGENKNLDSLFNIHHLENKSMADSHLRNKCASCHIGNEKEHPNPITEKSRGGGCTACHLNYTNEAKIAHQNYLNSDKKKLSKVHPSLTLKVTDNHCFGCHSRSGRISTNYEGWHETILKSDEISNSSKYRVLEDNRVFEKKSADIHHTRGLSCIDCHDSNDVMGDGKTYAHQEDAVNISCTDCHFSSKVKTRSYSKLDADEQRIIRLKNISDSYAFIYSDVSEKVLLNVICENDKNYLLTKNTNKKLLLSKPSSNCTKNAHKNLSCSSCHTNWSPQCISCHTKFDANEDGFDLKDKKWVMGKWFEKGNNYFAEFPTLGVVNKDSKKIIKTFAPGMIIHLEKENTNDFHRLFAPISAHTISAKGKSCKECHNNPVALGYGRGKLVLKNKKWIFKPAFKNEKDGLPKDAWIPFLAENNSAKATRTNARPFNLKEQRKILTVGACLTCHKENSRVVDNILSNFKMVLNEKKSICISPIFD